MIKTTKNAVGEFLRQSTTSKIGSGRALQPEAPSEGSGPAAKGVAQPTDLADLIMAYLTKHRESTPEDLVRELALPIGDALAALAQLEQFGFVRRRLDGAKTVLFLP